MACSNPIVVLLSVLGATTLLLIVVVWTLFGAQIAAVAQLLQGVSDGGTGTGTGTGTGDGSSQTSGTGTDVGTRNDMAADSGSGTGGSGASSGTTPALVSLTLQPASTRFPRQVAVPFTLTATYADDSTADIPTADASYSVSDSTVMEINAEGSRLLGLSAGAAQVVATLDGVASAACMVTVTSATLVSIAITPPTPVVARGGTLSLTATLTFSDASTLDGSSQVVWSSTNQLVATVDDAGTVTGIGGGATTIRASFGGGAVQGSTTLFVGS